MTRSLVGPAFVAWAASLWGPVGVAGQTVADLAAACVSAGGGASTCGAAALAGRELMGHMAVLAGPGSEVPAQSSALGTRLGGTPRFAPFLRAQGLSAGAADLSDPTGGRRVAPFVAGLQGGLALGVYDGLRILPTVGGLLSLDVVGQAAFVFLPEGEGFDGRVDTYSLGVRVGVLRESFTLPGVSLSVMRRYAGALRYGDTGAGDPGQVVIDPTITSYRVTAGKDLFAVGVMLGVSWDDVGSDAVVSALDGTGTPVTVAGRLEADRRTLFLGVSRQIGVLAWITAEIGVAPDYAPVTGVAPGVAQADGRTVFGSLALLLKL